MNLSGLTGIGLLGVLSLMIMQTNHNEMTSSKAVTLASEADSLRSTVREFLSCNLTMKDRADCVSGMPIPGIAVDGSQLLSDKEPYTTMGNGFQVRAVCREDDLFVEYAAATGPKAGQWQDLFSGIPQPCEACDSVFTYDPSEISCAIPVSDLSNIWQLESPWIDSSRSFKDQQAMWISPLPAEIDRRLNRIKCPSIRATEKLVYVTHFEAALAGDYVIEVVNDDGGVFELWRESDPGDTVLKMNVSGVRKERKVTLTPNHYAVVVDSMDVGSASAILLSIKDPSGVVIKRSEPTKDWCIFRATDKVDTQKFVLKEAACRQCLLGGKE